MSVGGDEVETSVDPRIVETETKMIYFKIVFMLLPATVVLYCSGLSTVTDMLLLLL